MDGERLEATREEAVEVLAVHFLDSPFGAGLSYENASGLAGLAIDLFIHVAKEK